MPHNRRSGGLKMAQGGGEDKAIGRTPAVFISYASQDAEAAKRICDALRAAGIEVWFDQSELRGGDVWDQRIRREIRDCTLYARHLGEHGVAARGVLPARVGSCGSAHPHDCPRPCLYRASVPGRD